MPTASSSPSYVYIGIDPGQSGGLVSFYRGIIVADPMPSTERDVWEWFTPLANLVEVYAVIEKVHSMPKQGVASSFKFGRGYGFLRGCITAAGISLSEVTPQAWQKALGIPKRGKTESKSDFKDRLRALAQQMFPALPLWNEPRSKGKQLAVADALLIMEYNRRKHEGRI